MEPLVIDADVRERWIALLKEDAPEACRLYFDKILPLVLDNLRARGQEIIEEERPDLLVSLMGFSPETTVICAAMARPAELVVVRSEETNRFFDIAAPFLTSNEIVPWSGLHHVSVDPTNPADIYDAVYRHLGQHKRALMDVTGGKKVMSATAAQAAWELRIPLCYVEGKFLKEQRRPEPGTEELKLLDNPSPQRARQARQRAKDMYLTGNYPLAADLFSESMKVNQRISQDELLRQLCRCYARWMDLDQPQLQREVEQAETIAAQGRMKGLVTAHFPTLNRHLAAHRKVAHGDRLALLATFLELASHYQQHQRHDFSCLLSYRAMEALVQQGLREAAGGSFDTSQPDYEALGGEERLEPAYVEISRALAGKGRVAHELPDRIGFIDGFALLCIRDASLPCKIFGGKEEGATLRVIKRLQNLASRRNGSVLAHGNRSLEEQDSEKLLHGARNIARAILGQRFDDLTRLQADLRPLELEEQGN